MDFRVNFHKTVVIRASVCRTILIRRALESPDSGESNGGSNFIFRHFYADLVAFEVTGWRRISNLAIGHPATSKAAMSAPKCRKMKFDPPLDAPGSGLSSARRINIVRQTLERVTTDL